MFRNSETGEEMPSYQYDPRMTTSHLLARGVKLEVLKIVWWHFPIRWWRTIMEDTAYELSGNDWSRSSYEIQLALVRDVSYRVYESLPSTCRCSPISIFGSISKSPCQCPYDCILRFTACFGARWFPRLASWQILWSHPHSYIRPGWSSLVFLRYPCFALHHCALASSPLYITQEGQWDISRKES